MKPGETILALDPRSENYLERIIEIILDSDHIFNASACGDNCAPWILKIGQEKDLTIRLGYLMDFGKESFDIEIANLHQIVHSMKELDEAVMDHHLL